MVLCTSVVCDGRAYSTVFIVRRLSVCPSVWRVTHLFVWTVLRLNGAS